MSIEECRDTLLSMGMNRFKVDEWYDLTQSSNIDIFKYDNIIFYFASNIECQDGYASKKTSVSFLSMIEAAIYERIKDQRLAGQLDVYVAVGLETLIQSVTNTTSMDGAIVNMFITLVITEILKVGISAWCKHYEAKHQNWSE